MLSQVRFNKVSEKVPVKVGGAEAGQVEQGSEEGLGGFGVEPGQVQQGSGEGSEKVWEVLVRFNRVPKKVPENVLGGFGAEPGQVC